MKAVVKFTIWPKELDQGSVKGQDNGRVVICEDQGTSKPEIGEKFTVCKNKKVHIRQSKKERERRRRLIGELKISSLHLIGVNAKFEWYITGQHAVI